MDSPGTILIVDDEPPIRKLLRRCFENEAYEVREAANGKDALAALESGDIDLITLDLSLGGEDGLNLARQIRSRALDVAIIMVSGKGELIDKVVGLEVGADDYIAKPFELREVLARVRSVLRRTDRRRSRAVGKVDGEGSATGDDTVSASEQSSDVLLKSERWSESPGTLRSKPSTTSGEAETATADAAYHFGGCILDLPAREFRDADDHPLELTTAEFDLLHLFLRSGRQALSRDRIMDELRGTDWNPNDRTIDNHVARLRRKLEAAGVERAIRTVRGIGYQFTVKYSYKADRLA